MLTDENMKKTFRFTGLLIATIFLALTACAQENDLHSKLNALNGVSGVQKLESTQFDEKYVMFIDQNLDSKKKNAGVFKQRVIVCHIVFDRPTVLVTEGYEGNRYLSPEYIDELASLFNTNIVVAEYRYFGESMPEPCDWQYLTVENSLYDLHKIRRTMGKIYDNKWIATGISKGGQTTMFYRSKFPEDVDISVPYVAPLNKSLEDGRHESFIRKVGDKKSRKAVQNFQLELLKRKETILPMFSEYCESKKYEFRLPVEEVFDYSVLEYSFAHWQFGLKVGDIPAETATDQELFDYAIKILEPNYFSKQTPYTSFNVQAVRELGYYGYDIKPFKKYLSIKSSKDYMRRLMITEELCSEDFNPALYNSTVEFLKNNDPKMAYIYGEWDPWTASGVTWLNTDKKKNLKVYVCPEGSHGTRINSFPEESRKEIINTIQGWLEE